MVRGRLCGYALGKARSDDQDSFGEEGARRQLLCQLLWSAEVAERLVLIGEYLAVAIAQCLLDERGIARRQGFVALRN